MEKNLGTFSSKTEERMTDILDGIRVNYQQK